MTYEASQFWLDVLASPPQSITYEDLKAAFEEARKGGRKPSPPIFVSQHTYDLLHGVPSSDGNS